MEVVGIQMAVDTGEHEWRLYALVANRPHRLATSRAPRQAPVAAPPQVQPRNSDTHD